MTNLFNSQGVQIFDIIKSGQFTRKGDEGIRGDWGAAQHCCYAPDFFAEASAPMQMRVHGTEEKLRMSQCEAKSEIIVIEKRMLRLTHRH